MKNELDQMIEETAKEIIDSGRTVEDVSGGLAGLGDIPKKAKVPKKKYTILQIETDVALEFKTYSRLYDMTQTEFLETLINIAREQRKA